MIHRNGFILAAVVALISGSGADLSSGPSVATIAIRNRTGAQIEHIYILPAEENRSDLLQGTPLRATESRLFTDVPCEEQDVKLVDAKGQACVFEDMFLCTDYPHDQGRRFALPGAQATWWISPDSIRNCVGFGRPEVPVRFVLQLA